MNEINSLNGNIENLKEDYIKEVNNLKENYLDENKRLKEKH